MAKNIQCTEPAVQLPALNATKHGILSAHLLLQWENASECDSLLEGMQREYAPEGVTEQHLVEELAGVVWRKRRLLMAERAHYQKAIQSGTSDNYTAVAALACIVTETSPRKFNRQSALASTTEQNQQELKEISAFLEPAKKAMALLESGATYEKALEALAAVTCEWPR